MFNEKEELLLLLNTIMNEEATTEDEFASFWHVSWISDDWDRLYFDLRDKEEEIFGRMYMSTDEFSEEIEDDTEIEDKADEYLRNPDGVLPIHYTSYVDLNRNNFLDDILENSEEEDYLVFDNECNLPPCFYISEEKVTDKICFKIKELVKQVLKIKLLNDLEENGKNIIKKCIRSKFDDNIKHLYYEDDINNNEFGKIKIGYDNEFKNELYIFGDSDINDVNDIFKPAHQDLLRMGETQTKNFRKWFLNECDYTSYIDKVTYSIEDKIEEI